MICHKKGRKTQDNGILVILLLLDAITNARRHVIHKFLPVLVNAKTWKCSGQSGHCKGTRMAVKNPT